MSKLREKAELQHFTLLLEDGAMLNYYFIGNGPGLIIVHGALSFALTQLDLAVALSHRYTVYLPSRRGRGLSNHFPNALIEKFKTPDKYPSPEQEIPSGYSPEFCTAILHTELSDLAALIKHTNADFALGVSAGAAILLEACVSSNASSHQGFDTIKKAIIFEPPIIFSNSPTTGPEGVDQSGMARYEQEMARGDVKEALTTATISGKLGSKWMQNSPRLIVRCLIGILVKLEKREIRRKEQETLREKGMRPKDQGAISMESLAPLLRYDFAIVSAMIAPASRYSKVITGREILLLGASNSPGYLKRGIRVLHECMDGTTKIEIPRAGHGVLSSKMWGGDVDKAVGIIERFLG